MNKESFYAGLGMFLAPFIIYLVYLLILSNLDWGLVGLGVLCFAYFGTAILLIIKGALSND